MAIWQACLWGLLGAGLVEIRGLWSVLQPARVPKWPWRDGRGRSQVWGYVIAVACRFSMAAGLDAVYCASQQITGPLAAVTMGIAAPLLIQQMAVRGDAAPTGTSQTAVGSEHSQRGARHSNKPPAQLGQGGTKGGADVH